MSRPFVDHSGKVFGNWTVLHLADPPRRRGKTYWACRCSCGAIVDVQVKNVIGGRTKRCVVCAGRVKKGPMVIRWGSRTMRRSEWAHALDMNGQKLIWRMSSGWTLREALTEGVDPVILDLLVPDQSTEPELLLRDANSGRNQ